MDESVGSRPPGGGGRLGRGCRRRGGGMPWEAPGLGGHGRPQREDPEEAFRQPGEPRCRPRSEHEVQTSSAQKLRHSPQDLGCELDLTNWWLRGTVLKV